MNWDMRFIGNVNLGLGFAAYNGLTVVIANLLAATALSLVVRPRARDETSPEDFEDRALA